MKRMIQLGTAVLVLIGVGIGFAIAKQDEKLQLDHKKFMQAKTVCAKAIVEGLALENFETIVGAAQDLMAISNDSGWKVIQTPEYLTMSDEFRASSERLRDAASDKNVDGATLAFFEVTLNCVQCHKYLRRRR